MSDISAVQNEAIGFASAPIGESAAFEGLDKDAFLKLLVAQMRYQNPLAPVDGQEYLAQAAQFATVERLEQLAERQGELIGLQKVSVASTLVGRHIVAQTDLGVPVSGKVTGVRFNGGLPMVEVDGIEVPLDRVLEIVPDPEGGGPGT